MTMPDSAAVHAAYLLHLEPSPSVPCASCDGGGHVYGEDPDGFVLCRECRAPLFYCDVGGQG